MDARRGWSLGRARVRGRRDRRARDALPAPGVRPGVALVGVVHRVPRDRARGPGPAQDARLHAPVPRGRHAHLRAQQKNRTTPLEVTDALDRAAFRAARREVSRAGNARATLLAARDPALREILTECAPARRCARGAWTDSAARATPRTSRSWRRRGERRRAPRGGVDGARFSNVFSFHSDSRRAFDNRNLPLMGPLPQTTGRF